MAMKYLRENFAITLLIISALLTLFFLSYISM